MSLEKFFENGIPENLQNFINKLQTMKRKENGDTISAHVVGGFVRDYLLGVSSKDIDIFTNLGPNEVKTLFPNADLIGGSDRINRMLTFNIDKLEVSRYRASCDRGQYGSNVSEHTATCDFTINALYFSLLGPRAGIIVDHYNGCDDLQNKILRFVGEPQERINEDPLRILRALRFIVKYNLDDKYVKKPLKDNILKLLDLPVERVRTELMNIYSYDRGTDIIHKYKLLQLLSDEYRKCYDLDGGKYHGEPVGQHMEMTGNNMSFLSKDPLKRFVADVHDIGKNLSQVHKEDGIHFYGHEFSGAKLLRSFMKKYKFSNKDIEKACILVKYHMIGIHDTITDIKLLKMFDDLEKHGASIEDLMMLIHSDKTANLKADRIGYDEFLEKSHIYQRYLELKNKVPFNNKQIDIDGNDIIKICNVKGSKIALIYENIYKNIVNGKLNNNSIEIKLYLLKKYNKNKYQSLMENKTFTELIR